MSTAAPIILVTENLGGNLHQAATTINALGLAEFVLTMSFSGAATVVVYRMTTVQRDAFKAKGALR